MKKMENLIEISGETGKYQYCALVLAFFVWSTTGFQSISIPFLENVPAVKLTNSSEPIVFNYDICGKNYTKVNNISYSWVNDLNIECDRFKVGLLGSFNCAGYTMGSFSFPFLAKIASHKIVILIGILTYCLTILMTILFPYYYVCLFALFLLGIGTELSNYSSMTIVSESVVTKKRSVFSSIINIGFSFCAILFVPLYLLLEKWKYVFLSHIIISLVILIFIFIFLYNSPRTYIDRNQPEEAEKILRGIAKFNGKLEEFDEKIQEEQYRDILYNTEKETDINEGNITNEESSKQKKQQPKIGYSALFKYPSIRYKFIIFSILFMSTSTIYNGIAIGAKDLAGNIHLNNILLYIFEGLAYISAGFLINCKPLGRKYSLVLLFVLSALGFLSFSILQNFDNTKVGQIIAMLLVRFTISGIYTTYFTYILENYPTSIRALGFGLNSTLGNIGSIVIPMLIELFPKKQVYYVFAGICAFDCILVFFLKETVGLPMQENIEELENEGEDKKELIKEEIKPISIVTESDSERESLK